MPFGLICIVRVSFDEPKFKNELNIRMIIIWLKYTDSGLYNVLIYKLVNRTDVEIKIIFTT